MSFSRFRHLEMVPPLKLQSAEAHTTFSLSFQRRITAKEMTSIIDARLEEFKKQLSRIKLHLEVEDDVKDYLMINGWSPNSGARQLEKVVRSKLLRPLASLLLEDRVRDGWTVRLGLNRGDIEDEIVIDLVESIESVDDVTGSQAGETSPSTSFTSLLMDHLDGEGATGENSASSFGLEREGLNSKTLPSTGPPVLQLLPQRLF